MELDDSVRSAVRDQQTVTPSGDSTHPSIVGVVTRSPKVHVDHRGRLFEFFSGPDDLWVDPVVFGHISSVRPLCMKGWGLHFRKDDRYTLVSGEVLVVLWDARMDSSTNGLIQRVFLAPDSIRQVLIPAGVWHASINLGAQEAYVINMPTQPYDHAAPDKIRLSRKAPEAPIDLGKFFPGQFDSSTEHDC